MIAGFGAALALLTRLPSGWLLDGVPVPVARCLWAFPLVGALVGAVGAAVLVGGRGGGMPPLLAGAWALGALVLVTGGLHEDGLADVADGFGGGRDRARKLEIMRDSRVGSYGVLALVVATAIRVTAMAPLSGPALIAACAAARAAVAVPMLLLAPARPDGLGAAAGRAGAAQAAMALAISAGLALALLPWAAAAALMGAELTAGLATAALARRQIGGFTGDVLGATALTAECAGLSALACLS